jgi:RHS repeat-associated protein
MKKLVSIFILIIMIMPIGFSKEVKITELFEIPFISVESESSKEVYFYVGSKLIASSKDGLSYKYNDRLGSDLESKSLPFGQPILTDNRFSFTGKELDSDLYYFGARYHDPEIGRFISVDPVKNNHPYNYASNNPINRIDPTGKDDFDISLEMGFVGPMSLLTSGRIDGGSNALDFLSPISSTSGINFGKGDFNFKLGFLVNPFTNNGGYNHEIFSAEAGQSFLPFANFHASSTVNTWADSTSLSSTGFYMGGEYSPNINTGNIGNFNSFIDLTMGTTIFNQKMEYMADNAVLSGSADVWGHVFSQPFGRTIAGSEMYSFSLGANLLGFESFLSPKFTLQNGGFSLGVGPKGSYNAYNAVFSGTFNGLGLDLDSKNLGIGGMSSYLDYGAGLNFGYKNFNLDASWMDKSGVDVSISQKIINF